MIHQLPQKARGPRELEQHVVLLAVALVDPVPVADQGHEVIARPPRQLQVE
jgi:hypothetical protein